MWVRMDKVELKIDWATYEATKFACLNYHYSKCVPAGKIVKIGVWENKKFIGVVLFSRGANSSLGSPYGLTQTQCCELTRIALTKHHNPVSRILKIAFIFLRKHNKGMRLIVSFADTEQNHHGGVYQATNWIYSGMTKSADEYMVRGKRMHGRSMRALYQTHIGKDFIKIVKGSSKHRYLMPLDDEIKKSISHLAKPYPKRAGSIDSDASGFQSGDGGANPTSALILKGV